MLNGYKIIGVCLAKVQDEFCRQLVMKLNEQAALKGYRVFVFSTNNDMFHDTPGETGERTVFDLIDMKWVDLIVYYDESLKSDLIFDMLYKKTVAEGKQLIVLDGHRDGCINLNFDYTGGFEKMVRHMVEQHSCRKIHYMSGIKGNSFSEERENVVKTVMRENQRELTDSDISYGNFWAEPTGKAMEKLLLREEIPDCIICANDAMALEVVVCLQKQGYRVPEDVKISGFDGIRQIFYSEPQISSSICDFEVVASKIIELYEDERPYELKCGEYKIFPSLLLLQSCGCGREVETNIAEHVYELEQNLKTYQNEGRVLAEIAAKIQTCIKNQDICRHLHNIYMSDMVVLLKKECLDESVNPFENRTEDAFGSDFVVMLDANEPEALELADFNREQIIPHLDMVLKAGMPVIFTSIHFMNVALGYSVYFYDNYRTQSYNRIFQLTSTLDNAFGGYRNLRFQKYLQSQVENSYKLDALTGLLNRTGFFREFDALVRKLQESGGALSMALADLDNLKLINDNYGHSEGDRAICAVADALRKACPNAICCRFGGDEMIAVSAVPMDYQEVCERVDMYMDETNRITMAPVPFSASIGIHTVYRADDMNFDEMLKIADANMYEVKRAKKIRRGEG